MVLLYGSGYTIHWPSKSFVTTGSLIVRVEPEDVTITVDGNSHTENPLRVIRLIPKPITVEISQEGYFTWEKMVDVTAKQSTFINTTLFKNMTAKQLLSSAATFAISPTGERTLLVNTKTQTVDLITESTTTSIAFPEGSAETTITWNPTGERAILGNSYLFSVSRPDEITALQTTDGERVEFVAWHEPRPWLAIVEDASGELQLFHTISKVIEEPYLPGTVTEENTTITENVVEYRGAEHSLPPGRYAYTVEHDNTLYIRNVSTQTMFAVTVDGVMALPFDAQQFETRDDILMFANTSEIWLKEGDDFSLLIRTSEPIEQTLIVEDTGYAAALINGQIRLIEFDGRDARNQFTLDTTYTYTDIALRDAETLLAKTAPHEDGTYHLVEFEIQ